MKRVLRKIAWVVIVMVLCVLPIRPLFAEENYDMSFDDPPSVFMDRLRFETEQDSIMVYADYHYSNGWAEGEPIKFCMYAYNQQTEQWNLVGGWRDSNTFCWEPDANDIYTVVIYVGYINRYGNIIPFNSCWREVSRPQMGLHVTGDCAMPVSDGLLYGCTSNINPNAADAGNYFTTCYIWSHDRQAWITQSSYRAWGSAWYRTATLPKGLYMMYNCTEKLMPDGSKRKLSCRYYLFNLS